MYRCGLCFDFWAFASRNSRSVNLSHLVRITIYAFTGTPKTGFSHLCGMYWWCCRHVIMLRAEQSAWYD